MVEAVFRSPQGAVIYEEPSSSGRMHLDKDGGAVLLTNPDGSTQLVLLTSDQRQQVAAAQSWKLPPPELPTYTVCICSINWRLVPASCCPSIAHPAAQIEILSFKKPRLGSMRARPVPSEELFVSLRVLLCCTCMLCINRRLNN